MGTPAVTGRSLLKEGNCASPAGAAGEMAIAFTVKEGAQDMTCPRCGGTTRVEARLVGDRWEIHTR